MNQAQFLASCVLCLVASVFANHDEVTCGNQVACSKDWSIDPVDTAHATIHCQTSTSNWACEPSKCTGFPVCNECTGPKNVLAATVTCTSEFHASDAEFGQLDSVCVSGKDMFMCSGGCTGVLTCMECSREEDGDPVQFQTKLQKRGNPFSANNNGITSGASGFGEKLSAIWDTYISRYNTGFCFFRHPEI